MSDICGPVVDRVQLVDHIDCAKRIVLTVEAVHVCEVFKHCLPELLTLLFKEFLRFQPMQNSHVGKIELF